LEIAIFDGLKVIDAWNDCAWIDLLNKLLEREIGCDDMTDTTFGACTRDHTTEIDQNAGVEYWETARIFVLELWNWRATGAAPDLRMVYLGMDGPFCFFPSLS
jgi:hypothetical protein